ncbi:unnamed protein product [Laminaria digitata]
MMRGEGVRMYAKRRNIGPALTGEGATLRGEGAAKREAPMFCTPACFVSRAVSAVCFHRGWFTVIVGLLDRVVVVSFSDGVLRVRRMSVAGLGVKRQAGETYVRLEKGGSTPTPNRHLPISSNNFNVEFQAVL